MHSKSYSGVFSLQDASFVKSFQVDDSSADDILQEVFIHIWDKRQAFKSEDHFKAYFYKALRNNTVKYITRNKHVLNLESAENKESDDVLLKITEIEFNREISRAISLLPEKRREIILLSMSGMSGTDDRRHSQYFYQYGKEPKNKSLCLFTSRT